MSTTERNLLFVALFLCQIIQGKGFSGHFYTLFSRTVKKGNPHFTITYDQRWNREIDDNSRKKAQGGGVGETVAGALLGSLVLGPFGAIFGASIGANIGARKAEMDAKRAEMERLGITQEMLDMAQDIGVSLEKSIEGIKAVRSSLETQQRLAQLLDAESSSLYKKAKQALDDSDEELAKKLLLQRVTVQEKLKKVLLNCVEEKGRLQIMEDNISRLERRAIEIDSLLRRTVSAKSLIGSAEFDVGLSLSSEDPLLQKFKDLGID